MMKKNFLVTFFLVFVILCTSACVSNNAQSENADYQVKSQHESTEHQVESQPESTEYQVESQPESTEYQVESQPESTEYQVESQHESTEYQVESQPETTEYQEESQLPTHYSNGMEVFTALQICEGIEWYQYENTNGQETRIEGIHLTEDEILRMTDIRIDQWDGPMTYILCHVDGEEFRGIYDILDVSGGPSIWPWPVEEEDMTILFAEYYTTELCQYTNGKNYIDTYYLCST